MRTSTARLALGWTIVNVTLMTSTLAAGRPRQTQGEVPARPAAQADATAPAAKGSKLPPPPQKLVQQAKEPSSSRTFSGLTKDFLQDQKDIWTSPAHLRFADTEWLVPLGGLTAGLFATDRQFSGHLSRTPSTLQHYRTIGTGGAAALVAAGGGLALWSAVSHDEHQREAGFLSGEAAIDSLVVAEALKFSLQRERPFQGSGAGHFFAGGSSFPSEHAAAAWSIAGILAHEYPGKVPKILLYGLATAVSISRIKSRDHFPSDVVVGSGIGWLVSQHVFAAHHDPELGGSAWNSWSEIAKSLQTSGPANQGSPYVPLDSWVYPALERLAGLGLIDSGFMGMRPWTRRECARLLNEATDQVVYSAEDNAETNGLLETLRREFRPELSEDAGGGNGIFRLESAYSRTEYISGLPINDGYHFAQTQINDFARPFGEGWNTVNGFSAYATQGAWVAYVRGELQTAPDVPAFSLSARQTIQRVDFLSQLPPGSGLPSVSQFALLDAYVGLTLSNWEFSFGRQSLWWGPGEGGPMMFSDNAAPLDMFRINRVSPLVLPWFLKHLGPMRVEFFIGQLRGQDFINGPNGVSGSFLTALNPQPMIHGERFSFKPTKNFEFGFSRTTLFAGQGVPFTLETFKTSLLSLGNGNPGTSSDPGDRRSGLDWSYRLPMMRDWLTFYGDAFADDQISPIAYWDRSAIRAGLYLSHVPGIPKLDLRAEGVYTDVPAGGALSHGFFYSNTRFLNGYTSDSYLLGSWIGREGQGAQAWTNYWFSARNRLQLNFRHQKISQEFIPNGGTLTDVGARGDYWVRSSLGVSAWVQYERWLFPIIQPNASTNVTAAVQINFEPQKWFQHSRISSEDTESGPGGRP